MTECPFCDSTASLLLKVKGNTHTYAIVVRRWPVKVDHVAKLDRTEINMIRWLCGSTLKERKKSAELIIVIEMAA